MIDEKGLIESVRARYHVLSGRPKISRQVEILARMLVHEINRVEYNIDTKPFSPVKNTTVITEAWNTVFQKCMSLGMKITGRDLDTVMEFITGLSKDCNDYRDQVLDWDEFWAYLKKQGLVLDGDETYGDAAIRHVEWLRHSNGTLQDRIDILESRNKKMQESIDTFDKVRIAYKESWLKVWELCIDLGMVKKATDSDNATINLFIRNLIVSNEDMKRKLLQIINTVQPHNAGLYKKEDLNAHR